MERYLADCVFEIDAHDDVIAILVGKMIEVIGAIANNNVSKYIRESPDNNSDYITITRFPFLEDQLYISHDIYGASFTNK